MMKHIHCVGLVFLIFCCQITYAAEDVYFANDYLRFLRVPGKYASALIVCRNNKVFALEATATGILSGNSNKFLTYHKLKERGVSQKSIFWIMYSKDYSRENENWFLDDEIAVLHVRSSSQVYFTFVDNPLTINLELKDANMMLIGDGKLPPNSRYTRIKEEDSDGYLVTAPKSIYLWENDAIDAKIACDIESTRD